MKRATSPPAPKAVKLRKETSEVSIQIFNNRSAANETPEVFQALKLNLMALTQPLPFEKKRKLKIEL